MAAKPQVSPFHTTGKKWAGWVVTVLSSLASPLLSSSKCISQKHPAHSRAKTGSLPTCGCRGVWQRGKQAFFTSFVWGSKWERSWKWLLHQPINSTSAGTNSCLLKKIMFKHWESKIDISFSPAAVVGGIDTILHHKIHLENQLLGGGRGGEIKNQLQESAGLRPFSKYPSCSLCRQEFPLPTSVPCSFKPVLAKNLNKSLGDSLRNCCNIWRKMTSPRSLHIWLAVFLDYLLPWW